MRGRFPEYQAVGVGLLLDFGRQFNKSPDCFSTGGEVELGAPPVVYRPQKLPPPAKPGL